MNYIKKLSILNESTNQYINLQFKEGTNIIIGPKGGGKSTLLSLIYALHTKTKIQS
jgi:ABC-type lipoprotein export system ATPase subunit